MKIKIILFFLFFSYLFAMPDQQLSWDNIYIYFAEKDAKIADIAMKTVQSERDRLARQYGLDLKPIHIHIADDQKTYNRYSGSTSPAWSAGLASHDKMLVKSPSFSRQSMPQFLKTLLHETVHLAVGDLPLPVWFNEGFAQYEAGQFGLHQRVLVSGAFWRNDLDSMQKIEFLMQMDQDNAEIAYAQCAAMVDFMVEYFSIGLVGKCLQYTREYNDFEKGFKNAFLMDTQTFEALFRDKAKNRYRFYILLDQSNIVWILSPFIVILGFILTKFRRRKLLAEWERQEEGHPDDPA